MYLLNHTLIGKIEWLKKAPETPHKNFPGRTYKQMAEEDLIQFLLRAPFETPPAAQKGIDFENKVYEYANRPEEQLKGSDNFKKVVNRVRGMKFQDFKQKSIELNGKEYMCYGPLDAHNEHEIVDLKTTAKFSPSNYEGDQDILYRFVTGIPVFSYLVAVWDEYPRIQDVFEIGTQDLTKEDLHKKVLGYCAEVSEFLYEWGLWDLYSECYCHGGYGYKGYYLKRHSEEDLNNLYFYWSKRVEKERKGVMF